jgi:DNA-binding transcriptional LysR family regulator
MSDWSDYRYFLAVARAGSLSAAARQLRVDQSTVGRRLAALEAQVGARLFDRTPEGYALTADGEGVRAEVEQLERGFLAVERRLAGGDARLAGTVRLATTETFATAFLIPHLGRLRAEHPALALELVLANHLVDLARREADLALRVGAPPKQPNLIARRIGVGGFALYAVPRYLARNGTPQLRGGLRGHAVIGYGGDLAAAPLGRWLAEHAPTAEVVLRANTIEAVRGAVAAGLGLGVLPCMVADKLERVGGSPLGSTPIWTIVHADLVRNARVRAVLTFLSELVHEHRRTLSGTASGS